MGKRFTKETFIVRAKEVHGDKYDYSKVIYTKYFDNIIIICPEHGEFEQTPSNHLMGHGCRVCNLANIGPKVTTDDFIAKAKEKHGNKYDYSLVSYVSALSQVTIVCKEHGSFQQLPSNHLKGDGGCKICKSIKSSARQTLTAEEFINRSRASHGDLYDYSLVEYGGIYSPVTIICKKHGEFKQTPNCHMNGNGCRKCFADRHRLSTEDFISRANVIHNNKYNYDLVEYKGAKTKVKITCKEHGDFYQDPSCHLAGNGCPACAKTGFDSTKEGTIYILQSPDMVKIGITNKSVSKRAVKVNRNSHQKFAAVFYKTMSGESATTIETMMLKWLKSLNLLRPSYKFEGSSECFYQAGLPLADIINKLLEFEREIIDAK